MDNLTKIEAVIFSEGGEISIKNLCKVLNISNDDLITNIQEYNNLNRGMVLVADDSMVLMRVSDKYNQLIKQLREDKINEDISKAGLEVLSIVMYCKGGDISTGEVEQIRGVNSGYTLRQLTIRGFLKKVRTGMSYRYKPTAELLSFLGITNISELPRIEEVQERIREFQNNKEEQND